MKWKVLHGTINVNKEPLFLRVTLWCFSHIGWVLRSHWGVCDHNKHLHHEPREDRGPSCRERAAAAIIGLIARFFCGSEISGRAQLQCPNLE